MYWNVRPKMASLDEEYLNKKQRKMCSKRITKENRYPRVQEWSLRCRLCLLRSGRATSRTSNIFQGGVSNVHALHVRLDMPGGDA